MYLSVSSQLMSIMLRGTSFITSVCDSISHSQTFFLCSSFLHCVFDGITVMMLVTSLKSSWKLCC